MEMVRRQDVRIHRLSPVVTVQEYDMPDPALGGGVAEITGRYPDQGYVVNTASREMVYVLRGQGTLIMSDSTQTLTTGDLVLIGINEPYAWDGSLTLFMANTPKFDPAQHKTTT